MGRPEVRRRRDAVVPNQHGAWGFLLLPVALGLSVTPPHWADLPAVLGWVALYPLSWAFTNRLAARRPERFTRPLTVWSTVAVPLLALAVVLDPWLVWVGALYLVPVATNVAFARDRRERALVNDLVLVCACTAAVPVTAGLSAGRGSWSPPWDVLVTRDVGLLTLACGLVLIGSTLHVKSLIRERNDPRYAVAAHAVAFVSIPVVAGAAGLSGVSTWYVVPFVVLAGRSVALQRSTWKPAWIGLVELGCLVLTVACSAVALA
ncbi:MAG: YwiC-like family protein [Propionibacteriales bacterium]|nr:YwiC-like family protein [Propionibacteriales bacterium]